MKIIASILLSIAICASAERGFAATYYVSPTGNDSAAGTSTTTAWQTIAQVNSAKFASGDQILFQAGGVWREMLQPNASNLTFSVYGTGARPLISGANLVTTPWSVSSGNICQSTVGGWGMTEVWINQALGNPSTSTSAIAAPGDWYYTNGVLYLDLPAGCAAGTTLPTIEVTARPYSLLLTNIGSITVENLGFVNGMFNAILLSTGLTGTQTFNNVLWEGAFYEGFLVNSGSPVISNSEGLNNDIGIVDTGGTGFSLTNSILSGNSIDAIEVWGTTGPSSIDSSTISGNATTDPITQTINNWTTNALTVSNSVILANPFIPLYYGDEFYNITDDGTNVQESPMFTQRAGPAIIVPMIDDYNNLGVVEQIAPLAAQYGCTLSYALNTKLVTPADWTTMQGLQASGVEIVAHTRSHSDLANNNVFSISYVGPAATATLTVNQSAGTLETFLNGSSTPDLNVPIGEQWNDILAMCATITANANYTCTIQPNQNFFTPLMLANVSLVSIKPSYMLTASSNYLTWEVEGSQTDINNNIPGYTVTSFATPFTSSNLTVEAHVQNAGFLIQRNGTVDINMNPDGNWSLSSLDIFNLGGYTPISEFNFAQPAGSIGALVEALGAQGGVMAFFAHGVDEFSIANWTQLFQLSKSMGATCMTMSQARAYIQSNGTLAQDGTKRRWVESIKLAPVFSTTQSSPTQGAHGLQ
jgi:hypothetical protein